MTQKRIGIIQAKEFDTAVLSRLFDKYKDELNAELLEHYALDINENQAQSAAYKTELASFVRRLSKKDLQLDAIIVVSLSASHYKSELQSISPVPIICLFDVMTQFLAEVYPCIKKVALLKAKSSFKAEQLRLLKKNYQLCFITDEEQDQLEDPEQEGTEEFLKSICEAFISNEVDLILPGLDSILSYSHILKYEYPLANPLKTLFKQMKPLLENIEPKPRFQLGIVGGMGPMATVDFITKLIQFKEASCDQEHMPLLIEHHPEVPDRTKAILGQGDDAFYSIYNACKNLEEKGASAIAVPCNTAHYFVNQFKDDLSVPVIHIVDESIRYIKDRQKATKVALLATQGTIKSQLYSESFEKQAATIDLFIPDEAQQQALMDVIHELKSSSNFDIEANRKALEPILRSFIDKGVDLFILGCTELPLLFSHNEALILDNKQVTFIDPTTILAKACLSFK